MDLFNGQLGLTRMEQLVPKEHKREFQTLAARMKDCIGYDRLYDHKHADHYVALDHLNRLAEKCEIPSYTELCDQSQISDERFNELRAERAQQAQAKREHNDSKTVQSDSVLSKFKQKKTASRARKTQAPPPKSAGEAPDRKAAKVSPYDLCITTVSTYFSTIVKHLNEIKAVLLDTLNPELQVYSHQYKRPLTDLQAVKKPLVRTFVILGKERRAKLQEIHYTINFVDREVQKICENIEIVYIHIGRDSSLYEKLIKDTLNTIKNVKERIDFTKIDQIHSEGGS